MKFTQLTSLMVVAGIGAANIATAQVNGTRAEAQFGLPVALQTQGTQFGNATDGQVAQCNGSELNGMYGYTDGSFVYLFISGNLETNFNKMNLWIDNAAGGQNRILAPFGGNDFGGFSNYADDGSGNGLTFDAGFAPDSMFNVTGGNTGSNFETFTNFWVLPTNPVSFTNSLGYYVGNGTYPGPAVTIDGGAPTTWNNFQLAINNSNTAGVSAFGGPLNDPSAVTTGIEAKIPLAAIGQVCDSKWLAAVNGGGHDFYSNQFLPGLGTATDSIGNLGNPIRNINLGTIPGNQFANGFPSTSGSVTYSDEWNGANKVTYSYSIGSYSIDGSGSVAANGAFKVCGPMKGGTATLNLKPKYCVSKNFSINTTTGAITISAGTFIQGDLDENDEVGAGDLQMILDNWDTNGANGGDANNDGEVGAGDFQIVLNNWQ